MFRIAGVESPHDVRMLQLAQQLRLAHEPRGRSRVEQGRKSRKLHRDRPFKPRVNRLEDDSHSPRTEAFEQPIIADLLRLTCRSDGSVEVRRPRQLFLQVTQMLGKQSLSLFIRIKPGDELSRIGRTAGAAPTRTHRPTDRSARPFPAAGRSTDDRVDLIRPLTPQTLHEMKLPLHRPGGAAELLGDFVVRRPFQAHRRHKMQRRIAVGLDLFEEESQLVA